MEKFKVVKLMIIESINENGDEITCYRYFLKSMENVGNTVNLKLDDKVYKVGQIVDIRESE